MSVRGGTCIPRGNAARRPRRVRRLKPGGAPSARSRRRTNAGPRRRPRAHRRARPAAPELPRPEPAADLQRPPDRRGISPKGIRSAAERLDRGLVGGVEDRARHAATLDHLVRQARRGRSWSGSSNPGRVFCRRGGALPRAVDQSMPAGRRQSVGNVGAYWIGQRMSASRAAPARSVVNSTKLCTIDCGCTARRSRAGPRRVEPKCLDHFQGLCSSGSPGRSSPSVPSTTSDG